MADEKTPPQDVKAIRRQWVALVAKPPIRWDRHDAVALVRQIPALLSEIEHLRSALAKADASVEDVGER